eukprot:3786402-Pyramimonas_sp.AAC.1
MTLRNGEQSGSTAPQLETLKIFLGKALQELDVLRKEEAEAKAETLVAGTFSVCTGVQRRLEYVEMLKRGSEENAEVLAELFKDKAKLDTLKNVGKPSVTPSRQVWAASSRQQSEIPAEDYINRVERGSAGTIERQRQLLARSKQLMSELRAMGI